MLFFISIFYYSLIVLFIVIDNKFNKDIFSAIKLASYFSAIEAFVMLWFSISPNAIEKHIFSNISGSFHNYENVIFAYLFSCFIYLFVVIGIFLGTYSSGRLSVFFSKYILNLNGWNKRISLKLASVMFLLGVIIYVYFIFKIGGLFNLWASLNLRTTLTAGLAYFQTSYSFLVIMATAIFYVKLYRKRRYLLISILLSVSFFMFVSLGQRAPVVSLVFILILLHNYLIQQFKRVLNFNRILLIGIALTFMLFSVQFRGGSDSDTGTTLEKIESTIIQRLGKIERQVVVIGYFNNHEYWGIGVYESLVYSFIPRGLYTNKPPVDTGVYINYISQGGELKPPVAAADLQPTSWPDEYLAGYVSFGFIGLVLLSIISGFFYGLSYRVMIRSSFSIPSIVLYGSIGFMGVTAFSPLGIVSLLIIIIPISLLGFLFRFRVYKRY